MDDLRLRPRPKESLKVRQESPNLVLIFDLEREYIHQLEEETAVYVWTNCTGEKSVKEIIDGVLNEFVCSDRNRVQEDVCEFLDTLHKEGLIDLI